MILIKDLKLSRSMVVIDFYVLIFVILQFYACGNPPANNPGPQNDTTYLSSYSLVWQDEFDGTTLDTSKWNYEVNGNGGGNNELQYYTNFLENCYVKGGFLIIKALKKDYKGKLYTSARINTSNKGDWKYGKFEICAKLPKGQGLWPAIWMLPTDWVYGGWPLSGEIDIMEELGQKPEKIYGTIHYGNPPQEQGGNITLTNSDVSKDFHIYSIEWDYESIRFFVDSINYYTAYVRKPFDQRFHFVLNVAVGGNWPGSPDSSTIFPQQMVVDYVRVYQKLK